MATVGIESLEGQIDYWSGLVGTSLNKSLSLRENASVIGGQAPAPIECRDQLFARTCGGGRVSCTPCLRRLVRSYRFTLFKAVTIVTFRSDIHDNSRTRRFPRVPTEKVPATLRSFSRGPRKIFPGASDSLPIFTTIFAPYTGLEDREKEEVKDNDTQRWE